MGCNSQNLSITRQKFLKPRKAKKEKKQEKSKILNQGAKRRSKRA